MFFTKHIADVQVRVGWNLWWRHLRGNAELAVFPFVEPNREQHAGIALGNW